MSKLTPKDKAIALRRTKHLQSGYYVPKWYIYADGIIAHVQAVRQIGEYTLYIGKIKGINVVSDGKGHYAYCGKFCDAIADILYKTVADRGAAQYKGLTMDSEVKAEDDIVMYHIITGACRQGTQSFINTLCKLKEAYTVREIVNLTIGKFGSERFKAFFKRMKFGYSKSQRPSGAFFYCRDA